MHSVAMITVDTKPLIVATDADFQQTGSFSNVDEFFTPDEEKLSESEKEVPLSFLSQIV